MARNASSPRRSRSGCAPSGASKMVPAGSRVSGQQCLLNQYLEAQLCASGSGASKMVPAAPEKALNNISSFIG